MPVVAAGLVLVPGIHAWWTGRKLMERMDDPAFPELLFARGQHRSTISVIAGAVAILAGGQWVLMFALLVIAQLAGGFPFRKAVFGETWSIGQYLRFSIISLAGTVGFWLLLGFSPPLVVAIVKALEPAQPVVAASLIATSLAMLLLVWDRQLPRLWLALHHGSPLERPDLQARLDEIVRRSGVAPVPTVHRFGAPGS